MSRTGINRSSGAARFDKGAGDFATAADAETHRLLMSMIRG